MATAVRLSIGFMLATSLVVLSGCNSDDPASSTGATAPTTASSSAGAAVNTAPTIGGKPLLTVVAGTAYSFSPTTADPSGSALTFSIKNKPSWASFDTTSGTLSGVPEQKNVGTYAGIVIQASNGSTSVALAPFDLSVTAAAATATLTIAGTPATTVSVGAPYGFHPTAADAAGSKLTFSIDHKPAWATFDTTTGGLSGTPVAADVGVTSQIAVHVSDGTRTASLPVFNLTVRSGTAESVTLSWTQPSSNSDGTPVVNLSGYRIYYGTSVRSMTKVVTVEDPEDTRRVVANLTGGTWYFAVTSFNEENVESRLSAIVPVTL